MVAGRGGGAAACVLFPPFQRRSRRVQRSFPFPWHTQFHPFLAKSGGHWRGESFGLVWRELGSVKLLLCWVGFCQSLFCKQKSEQICLFFAEVAAKKIFWLVTCFVPPHFNFCAVSILTAVLCCQIRLMSSDSMAMASINNIVSLGGGLCLTSNTAHSWIMVDLGVGR